MEILPSAENSVLVYFTEKHHKEGQEDLVDVCLMLLVKGVWPDEQELIGWDDGVVGLSAAEPSVWALVLACTSIDRYSLL